MIKYLIFFLPLLCHASHRPPTPGIARDIPFVFVTVNNNTDNPLLISVEVNDPDDLKRFTEIIQKPVRAHSSWDFIVETEK